MIAYGGFGACANTNGGNTDADPLNGATGGANNCQGSGNACGGDNYTLLLSEWISILLIMYV